MRRHEEAADAVHLVVEAVDIDIDGVEQVVGLLAHNLLVLVDNELIAKAILVVGDGRQVGVEELLEGVQLAVGLEEAEAVGLLLRGNLHAAKHKQAALATHLLRHLDLTSGVVVGDGNHVQPTLQGTVDDGRGRHLEVAARREDRVDVEVGFERRERH